MNTIKPVILDGIYQALKYNVINTKFNSISLPKQAYDNSLKAVEFHYRYPKNYYGDDNRKTVEINNTIKSLFTRLTNEPTFNTTAKSITIKLLDDAEQLTESFKVKPQ